MPKQYRPTRRLEATRAPEPGTQMMIDFSAPAEAPKVIEGAQQEIEFKVEPVEVPAEPQEDPVAPVAPVMDTNELPSTQEVAALQMTQIPHPAPPDQTTPVEPVVDEQLKSLPKPSDPVDQPILQSVIKPTDYSREKKPRR